MNEIVEQKDTQEAIGVRQRTTIFDDGAKIESVRLDVSKGVTIELLIHTQSDGKQWLSDVGVHHIDKVGEFTIYGRQNEQNRKLKQSTKLYTNFRTWNMSMGEEK